MNEVDRIYFKSLADVMNESFDYIVIGGGAYGTSFSHRILELCNTAKVLILEKGSYLIPDHIQNIPPSYIELNTEVGTRPWKYIGASNLNFMPQIPYVGGRALFWNAWTPQPDKSEMPDWPDTAIERLTDQWYSTGEFMGRRYSLALPGNQNQRLANWTRDTLFSNLDKIDVATTQGNPAALDSAMATGQGVAPEDWAKFSPISILVQDVQRFPKRLQVVVQAEVNQLTASAGQITHIETSAGSLPVGGAKIILACNTLEAGFLLTKSFPEDPLIGKNLCGHIRSWLAARIPASEVAATTDQLQAVALYMPGRDAKTDRLMHTHISVVHNPTPELSSDLLYKILPDASTPEAVKTYQDPDYVVIMLHSMGEFLGERSENSCNYVCTNSEGEAEVHMALQPHDEEFWVTMDKATYQVLEALAGNSSIEYQHNYPDGSFDWKATPPANIRNKGLVHEAGTLWMGENVHNSVTNHHGQMHRYPNVFGLGSMLFPRPGSWNPTLTGVAQAFALAKELSK